MHNSKHVLAGTLTACLAVSAFADDKPQSLDTNGNGYQPARASGVEMTNLGVESSWTFQGHELNDAQTDGLTWLYGPSEADDAGMRASIDGIAGSSSDYFDARAATPDVALLSSYDVVVVWANFAFLDNVAYGDNLAQAADNGTTVILGAFCTYTSGNSLAGQIMTPGYSPVTSPTGTNHFSVSCWSGDNPCGSTAYDGLGAGTLCDRTFRDFHALQGAGVQCGTDDDGEITMAGTNLFGGGAAVASMNGVGGNLALGTGPDHNLWLANGILGLGATPVDCVCDAIWSVGDRVVKSAETGSGGPAVGSLGTVVSGTTLGTPNFLVSWDGFAGHDGNGFAECPPATVPDFTGWYVHCDEVSAAPSACPGDVNGDGKVDVEDLLLVLGNWGCQVG